MTATLIISTYNWPEALELCLLSVLNQSKMPLEVIIADDGSKLETKLLIEKYKKKFTIPLNHVWHEDKGFRLAEIRNKAIKISSGEYIIQVDGDVILHKNFIEDHLFFNKQNTFVKGKRCMIGEKLSKILLEKKSIKVNWFSQNMTFREHGIRLKSFQSFFKVKEKATSDGVTGSNMAFFKNDFEKVNGYNIKLVGWGAEDKELAQRFVNLGLKQRKMKFIGIQYHIFHPQADNKNHDKQMAVIKNLRKSKLYFCQNGLNQV